MTSQATEDGIEEVFADDDSDSENESDEENDDEENEDAESIDSWVWAEGKYIYELYNILIFILT